MKNIIIIFFILVGCKLISPDDYEQKKQTSIGKNHTNVTSSNLVEGNLPTETDFVPYNPEGEDAELKLLLRDEIAPQAVKKLLETFPKTFGSLKNKKVGIGLSLDKHELSSSQAAVINTHAVDLNNPNETFDMGYELYVNYSSLDWNGQALSAESRIWLEQDMLHEMMHALMFEALTSGMVGHRLKIQGERVIVEKEYRQDKIYFPSWFVEGAAQVASGGFKVVDSVMRFNKDNIEDIKNSLTKYKLCPASRVVAVNYGTGWLAIMYLSWLQSGSNKLDPQTLADGFDTIMNEIQKGKSLDTVIREISNGKFAGLRDFEQKFAEEGAQFVRDFLKEVGGVPGSVVTTSYTTKDLLPDEKLENYHLFYLHLDRTRFMNKTETSYQKLNTGSATMNHYLF